MFSNKITAALFAIAIASSLILVSGGGFVGSVLAKKAKQADEYGTAPQVASDKSKDKSPLPAVLRDDTPKSHSVNAGDSGGSTGQSSSGTSAKDLKSLSKCESSAAADGDLTLAEVKDCYRQVF
jgi:hypothetical protein